MSGFKAKTPSRVMATTPAPALRSMRTKRGGDVEVHKPRPVHNWRELLSEIAVVVIGVVIALTAEQLIQRAELRAKMRHAEQQMRDELALDDGPQMLQRVALAPCIEESLTAIRTTVDQGEPRTALLRAIERFDPPLHTWDSVAFQEATATGVLSEMPSHRQQRWSYLYAMMPVLERANEREFLDVAKLRALSGVGGPLIESERGRLLEAVESLRRDNAEIVHYVTPTVGAMRELGIRVGVSSVAHSDIYAPSGPGRVIEQLKRLPMATACVPALEQAMHVSP